MNTFNDTTMSEDGYPTEEYLAFLKAFDPFKYSIQDFLLTLGDAWWYGDWGYKLEGNHLVLATGGWPGNEEAGKIGSTNRKDGKPWKYNGAPCNILDADIDMLPLTDEYFPLSHIREYVKKKVKK